MYLDIQIDYDFNNLTFKVGIQISIRGGCSWHVFLSTKRFGLCARDICIPTRAFSITTPVCIRATVNILETLLKDIKAHVLSLQK